jgi:hypothetical protein
MDSIKVTKTCGRCGHKDEREVTLEDVMKLEEQRQERKDTSAKLQALADSLHEMPEAPQMLVMLRNSETGLYDYNALYDLCDRAGDDTKRRGCTARVADLLKDLFNVKDAATGEKKERKPRTKKVKVEEVQETTTDDTTEA